ncbi:arginine--tRNA ligase [Rubripirellula sp.]|nr:arginine--tRNA ligase [Rubripirellula sp.]MDB4654497.1 arginine--tRNA ligase [Rubripirellula sp.]
MHVPHLLQQRFIDALRDFTDRPEQYASMIRGTSDPKHGDYQANCAMPLAKQSSEGKNPREIAAMLVAKLKLDDLCEPPEIAGPGFINLKLKDSFLSESLAKMVGDDRCGVTQVATDKSIVIDFSSPNVAKPMHVGHIRSTVIGDSLARILRFLGYPVVTDNHLGDWGTQFGIIIYGYKHFGDSAVVDSNPVTELAKLYRIVNQLVEYRKAVKSLPKLKQGIEDAKQVVTQAKDAVEHAEDKALKKAKKTLTAAERRLTGAEASLTSAEEKILTVEQDPILGPKAKEHANIDTEVLEETAKLHRGDQENIALWNRFLPHCKDEINRMYARLDIHFDHTLGESFYHPMLADVTSKLEELGLASDSDGALCVFLPEFDAPMIIRKQDGAYLYATTDLATLEYRLTEFNPSEILYVVDTRQSEHFDKLFAVADHFGLSEVKLVHVNFGTVLGEDGRPMKTRSGTLIGLESLLNDAVDRAKKVVCNPERLAAFDPPMDAAEQENIAEAVGIGAIKFADLSHHRTSDYRFNLDKMVALDGNTSAYVQYSYARMQKILQNADASDENVATMVKQHGLEFTHIAERNLVLQLIKFEEALTTVHKDYAPNHLVDYLLETAKAYSRFNDNCHVLKAESESIRATRLAIVVHCKQTLGRGLNLLGIDVVRRM